MIFHLGRPELLWLLIVFGLWAVYFAPVWVAYQRRHPRRLAILLLNTALGWTVIGWIVALAWAAKSSPSLRQAVLSWGPSQPAAMRESTCVFLQ